MHATHALHTPDEGFLEEKKKRRKEIEKERTLLRRVAPRNGETNGGAARPTVKLHRGSVDRPLTRFKRDAVAAVAAVAAAARPLLSPSVGGGVASARNRRRSPGRSSEFLS